MPNELNKKKLLSHTISPETLQCTIEKIAERIKQQGDKPYVDVKRQLELLSQLKLFDFGRYLIQNRGINGYWTHYMLTYPWFRKKTEKNNRGECLSELESFILNRAPSMLATQQRFEIFLKENQKQVKDNAKLCSIPCGMMGELLYLDYEDVANFYLIGIDYDSNALDDAKLLAKQKCLSKFIKLIRQDAWDLNVQEEFDLISSNGLNIYETNDNRISQLYKKFYTGLKLGGKLVTSFLTPPPSITPQCEWDMSKIDQHDLLLQKIIFSDIIDAKWQCYRSSEQTYNQLKAVGFSDIQFIYDLSKMFPTVIAYKK
ncbi:MAG TPA: class I SAM-dependent methyltransferase [Candidatus Aquirickettsiella sp.]|jgi:SAM-dependent methyltransferase